MAPSLWHSPSVVVVCVPPDLELDALRATTAEAIVLDGENAARQVGTIAAVRGDLPLILLADATDAEVMDLIAAGADEVLPRKAALTDIARVVRHAISRRRRRARPSGSSKTTPIPGAPQLEAVGRLAAGLGHEFNNLLVIIDGNAELLRNRMPDGHSLRQAADAIVDAGGRAATLTRQLLAFGRQQRLVPAQADLNALVGDAASALRNAMGKRVRVVTRLGQDLPPVRVDPAQLKEVLSNLAATAVEAMPVGGTFAIETDAYVVNEEEREQRHWLPPGPYLRLQVSDTGLGIEEQALPHLFEPFYTPDGVTRGSGLTLSSVYGVVKQSGGYIWVDSEVNQGTRVTILFPPIGTGHAAPPDYGNQLPLDEPEPAGADSRRPVPAPRIESGSSLSRVLLVEDIDGVRDILKNLLEIHEFEVIPAPTAEDALELAKKHRFDILLTDVALPGLSGPELARDIRRMYPGTPVLFMSGHPANSIDPLDLEDARGFLQKPFSAVTLVQRLNELLGTRPAGR
jgi:two-component system, cell cycle sensor histidine kinase and response regulator CckA